MHASIVAARVIGPLLMVNGIAMLLNGKSYQDLAKEFISSRALTYLAGFMTLFIGLGVVNVARPDWPIALRIVGWLFVVGGALRMLFTDRLRAIGMAALDQRPGIIKTSALVQLAIGLSIVLSSRLY